MSLYNTDSQNREALTIKKIFETLPLYSGLLEGTFHR